ncbi:MAG: glycerophosphodiester phosphodiesterase family protein [Myxococcota bacterium]
MVLVGWTVGCAGVDTPPTIEASAGGAAYWPPNSATAIDGAIETGLDAIELDVSLTRDGVPVIVDGPWITPDRCTFATGQPLDPEGFEVRWATAAYLASFVRCGGIPDPAFDGALVVAEPPLTLDALVARLVDAPSIARVHLDIRYAPGLTAEPDRFAAAVLDGWTAVDLSQSLTVSSAYPEVLTAFDAYGRSIGRDVPTWLAVPQIPYGADPAGVLAAAEAEATVGGLDLVSLADAAGADGVIVRWDVADRRSIAAGRAAGLEVAIGEVDDLRALRWWARPGEADTVITAWPGEVE